MASAAAALLLTIAHGLSLALRAHVPLPAHLCGVATAKPVKAAPTKQEESIMQSCLSNGEKLPSQ